MVTIAVLIALIIAVVSRKIWTDRRRSREFREAMKRALNKETR